MKLPDVIFSDGLDYALGWTVVHSLWQVTLIAFITGIVLIALRRKSAQLRYFAANMGLLASLLSAVITFSWYMQPVPVEPILQTAQTEIAAAQKAAKPLTAAEAAVAKPGFVLKDESKTPPVEPAKTKTLSLANFKRYFNQNLPLLVLLWFAGMAIFLLKLLGLLLQTYDLRRHMNFPADPYWSDLLDGMARKLGSHPSIALLESALVRSPLTLGHLKPLILFPIGVINRLSEQEVEAILAHEMAHILRRDYLFNILQSVVEAIFYFHPAIWWISRQVRNEREHACDDQAVALLGSKINYAKALVAIQEMAFLPQTPALAFAGQRRNQLMYRIQRLFNQQSTKSNIMEKGIASAIVLCLVFVLAIGQGFQTNENLPLSMTQLQENAGLWEAEFTKDSVHLTLSSGKNRNNWMMGDDFAIKDFDGLNVADGKTQFQMLRPAGKMTFRGDIEGKTGYGRFEFVPDDAYRSALEKQGIKDDDDDDNLLMMCFFAGFPASYVDNVKKMGIGEVDADKLEQLAAFRLTEPRIKAYQDIASNYGKKQVDVEDIVQMDVANVTDEKLKSYAKAGYTNLDFDDITAMSLHGVDADFIAKMNGMGFGKLDADEMMSAKIHGIDADKLQELNNLGLGKLNFDDVMTATIHDIDADFVKQVKAMGFENPSFDDVVSMKIHGIDPEFVKHAKNMGFDHLGADEIMTMKIHGIDEDYVKQVKAMGLPTNDLDEVMSLKIHDITPEFVQQANAMGFGPLDADEIMSLKVHGIDEAYIKQVKDMGLEANDIDEVMSLKIHGITPEFVKQANAMGFGKLDADEIMSLKIHGIDEAYVKQVKDMGVATNDLDEVMGMKIHGITPEFVKECKAMNIGADEADDFMSLKIHGVTPEFVKSFRDLKIQDIDVDAAVGAKIHDVTPAFIQDAEKRGYHFPSLEEYVDLKVRDRVRNKRSQ